jgi:hypothetical protein
VQPLPQVGVRHRLHPGPRRRLFLLHRRLGAETARDVLLHPPHPPAGAREHPVGLQNLALLRVAGVHPRQHLVHVDAQLLDRHAQPLQLHLRIVGHGPRHHHARLVQPDMAHRRAFLRAAAPEHRLRGVPLPQGRALAGEGAKLGHLGHDHRHDFQRVDLVAGIFPLVLRLHHQNAQPLAQPHDRHAEEGRIPFLPRLRHVAEPALPRRIGGVDRPRVARHPPHQSLADPHPRDVHGLGRKTLGGAQFQRVSVAQQVDRAHLGPHRIRDQVRDAVQPFLPLDGLGHHRLQARQKLAALAFALLDHRPLMPPRPFWTQDPLRPVRALATRNRHSARLRRGATGHWAGQGAPRPRFCTRTDASQPCGTPPALAATRLNRAMIPR